ncbi:MAG: Holliday junction resolvase RuvX [Candidatus Marinimicrobia bacterium]|jgi:putative Holliday junction resolvase|nr:Holliday junction resolvase RuvX [Candidatus Neomarinimicrobiota bacterium]MDD5710171.1 Holliday junction resolvase RuvX [Candidatus Neomarinimicrobiota bacterium]MDX9778209.1 Holliday junction resolvase RuvX [bacterium]
MMQRILAVDYGERRIGVAVSDPLRIIATPLETLIVNSPRDGIRKLTALCREYDPECIIVGYPIGISGRKTEQTLRVENFIKTLKAELNIPVIPWDERYTSAEARGILYDQGIRTRGNKGKIDQMAARIMLQEYLNTRVKR